MILLAIFLEKYQSNQTDLLHVHIHTETYLVADTFILKNIYKLYCSAVLGKWRRNRLFFSFSERKG